MNRKNGKSDKPKYLGQTTHLKRRYKKNKKTKKKEIHPEICVAEIYEG